MKQSWDDYERAAETGPLSFAVKAVIGLTVLGVLVGAIGYGLGWFSEAAQVAKEEFGPREALRKYEYFKDVAAQLEKKRADIGVFEARMKAMEESYGEEPRRNWARHDAQQYNTWVSEVAGAKASYNDLAADYNAQMTKFNWRFAEVGELPEGAEEPLPREFKPYITH